MKWMWMCRCTNVCLYVGPYECLYMSGNIYSMCRGGGTTLPTGGRNTWWSGVVDMMTVGTCEVGMARGQSLVSVALNIWNCICRFHGPQIMFIELWRHWHGRGCGNRGGRGHVAPSF